MPFWRIFEDHGPLCPPPLWTMSERKVLFSDGFPDGGRRGDRGKEGKTQSTQTPGGSSYSGEEQSMCQTQVGQPVANGTNDPGGGMSEQGKQTTESNAEPGRGCPAVGDSITMGDQPVPARPPRMPDKEDTVDKEDHKRAIK